MSSTSRTTKPRKLLQRTCILASTQALLALSSYAVLPIPLVQFFFGWLRVSQQVLLVHGTCSARSPPSTAKGIIYVPVRPQQAPSRKPQSACAARRRASRRAARLPTHPPWSCILFHWLNPRPVMLSSVKSTQLDGGRPMRSAQAVQPKRFYRERMYSVPYAWSLPSPSHHHCVCVLRHFLLKVSFTHETRSFSIPADLLMTCQSS